MADQEETFSIGNLKLRGRLFRLWVVLSVVCALAWLALSGPQLLSLIRADSITCFPVIASIEHQYDQLHTADGLSGSGACDSKTFRFVDLSQPEKEVAIRINHINVFDARGKTFQLLEREQLNADQGDQLGWYFQDKAAQRRRQVDFLLIYILGPIFSIPFLLLIFIRASRWVKSGT